MNRADLERAIKKQHLLLESKALRDDFAAHARGIQPACQVADGAVAGARWLHAHPQVVIGFSVAFLVAQPKRAWRWTRRAFSVWQTWSRVKALLARHLPV